VSYSNAAPLAGGGIGAQQCRLHDAAVTLDDRATLRADENPTEIKGLTRARRKTVRAPQTAPHWLVISCI
jgi:hypothetical protein